MKKIFVILSAALLLASCDPIAESVSGEEVTIDMDIVQVSAGFIEVNCCPRIGKWKTEAYYLFCVEKAYPGIDPYDYEQPFMDISLDSAYVSYVQWRHQYLAKGEKNVADFPSHSLQYGETTLVRTFLEPDTDYWVYCFVVDANTNKANGKLFCRTVHTCKESQFKNLRYAYRVRGQWDYIYPYDKVQKELVTSVPFAAKTIDSLVIRNSGARVPGEYFDRMFSNLDASSTLVHTGVYAFYNDGVGDGSSDTCFEEGKTYYTAIATVDGPRNDSFDIYKFTWTGDDFEMTFQDEQSTLGGW